MNIKITPTPAQMDTYNAIRKAQLLCEAENALLRYFELEASSDLKCPEFEMANGFTIADAINPNSPNYVLESMVENFEERKSYDDGRMSDWTCWEMAVESVSNSLTKEETETLDATPLYRAEGEIVSSDDAKIADSFVLFDRDYDRLKKTTGDIIKSVLSAQPDGRFVAKIVYESGDEYLDSDECDATVENGSVNFEY